MGYCFFNAVALAAEVIVRSWGNPVLIVDFDLHHGNGTQRHFYDRPDVGYVSVHLFPGFPGSGTAAETGEGRGLGTIRNIPLAAGADDTVFCSAFEDAVSEVATRLRPSAVLVSAGFDAHASDPLGEMRLSEQGYRRLTAAVTAVAQRWSAGRVLSFLEGGFNLQALANCARIHVEELSAGEVEKADA
jgi:acetoin utilization deacetylase AcuC-like enzyme